MLLDRRVAFCRCIFTFAIPLFTQTGWNEREWTLVAGNYLNRSEEFQDKKKANLSKIN